jgi:hypothetical protein
VGGKRTANTTSGATVDATTSADSDAASAAWPSCAGDECFCCFAADRGSASACTRSGAACGFDAARRGRRRAAVGAVVAERVNMLMFHLRASFGSRSRHLRIADPDSPPTTPMCQTSERRAPCQNRRGEPRLRSVPCVPGLLAYRRAVVERVYCVCRIPPDVVCVCAPTYC